ncbi:MAG: 5'-nucleotidase, lipoprotein e(P4) family [Ferruginibacter sp.]
MIRQLIMAAAILLSISLPAQTNDHKPSQYNVNSTLWQQQSGEYKALCYQAFHIARLRLQEILLTNKDSMPLAVITDVDETVLDNSPSSAHDILLGRVYEDTAWRVWVNLAAAKALPGAVEFFNYAAQHGVQCFYLTNRKESQKGATMKNLQQLGFPQVDTMHMLMKGLTGDKEPRRQQLEKKYNVVLLLGDNLNDFDDLFYEKPSTERNAAVDKVQSLFGSKYIVLPNAAYGDWENALWQGQKPTAAEKDRIKWSWLKGY